MKKIICTIIILISFATIVPATELISTKSKDVTSEDIPLKFILEKTVWDGDDILIDGTVKNPTERSFDRVKVIFTVKSTDGAFIGRQSCSPDPREIGAGQVGYIERKHVYCEGRKPSIIEFSVIGREK